MKATVAVAFLAILLPLTLGAPAAQACSLAIPSAMERVVWVSDDRFVTYTGSGFGVYNVTRANFTATFEPLMVTAFAAQPGGEWVVAAYWDGRLGADCSHPMEATHAFNLRTLERVELFDGPARSFAANADHVIVFAAGCHAPVRFAWGQWSEPEFLQWPPSSRPDIEPRSVDRAALSPNGRHLAFMDGLHIRVHDVRDNNVEYEESWPMRGYSPHAVFAFDASGSRLAYASTGESSTLVVLRDLGESWGLVATRSDPSRPGAATLTGNPAWRGMGLAAATSNGLRVFADATNLTRSVDHSAPVSDAYVLGQAAWSPDMDTLAVGLQVRRSDMWSDPQVWLLDASYATIAQQPLYVGPRQGTVWKAATVVEHACDVPGFEQREGRPVTLPSLSIVTVMVLGAAVVALRRLR